MGFSLKMYFEELNALLIAPGLSDRERLTLIRKHMEKEEKYARECGQIKD